MAAFTAKNPHDGATFQRHWDQILSDKYCRNQTVVWRGKVAGYVSCFELFGKPSLAYWIGREFWGQGIATAAVRLFLRVVPDGPSLPGWPLTISARSGFLRSPDSYESEWRGTTPPREDPKLRSSSFDLVSPTQIVETQASARVGPTMPC